jgi:hypothetical protein
MPPSKESPVKIRCDALVTRNKGDFGDRPNVLDPAEVIERIKTSVT